MTRDEIAQIRLRVAEVGAKIQPLLQRHTAHLERNAYAHIWLGIRTRFAHDWRERSLATEIEAFVGWIGENPNAPYEEFAGPTTRVFSIAQSAQPFNTPAEPSLFD